MKCKTTLLLGLLLALPLPAFGQTNYTVDWFTIDGGGGTSTGGSFTLSGSVGQPDAGAAMTGGGFTLVGGFWAAPMAVQTPGAPALTVMRAGPGLAAISWNPPTPGFMLQSSPTLIPPTWTNASSGTTNPIIIPATLPARFYRLLKQ